MNTYQEKRDMASLRRIWRILKIALRIISRALTCAMAIVGIMLLRYFALTENWSIKTVIVSCIPVLFCWLFVEGIVLGMGHAIRETKLTKKEAIRAVALSPYMTLALIGFLYLYFGEADGLPSVTEVAKPLAFTQK
jgi:hypothetical protein